MSIVVQQTVAVSASVASTTDTSTTITNCPAGSTVYFHYGVLLQTQQATPSCPNTTWTRINRQTSDGNTMEEWLGVVGVGGTGTTLTLTGIEAFNATSARGQFKEFRSPYAVAFLTASTTGTSATPTTPTITPIASVSAVVVACMRHHTAASLSSGPTNSFTDPNVSGSALSRTATKIEPSTSGSYSTVWTMSLPGAWSSAIFVLYELTPSIASITTQPSNVATGVVISPSVVVKALTDGVNVDTGVTANCVATIASGLGTISAGGTVACVAGVATFTALVVTGDGNHTLSFAISGYTSATSSSFGVIGTVTAATRAFIAANGGDALIPAIYDARLNLGIVSAKVATWDDAAGTHGSRTPGPQRAQATAGNRPALTGTQGSGAEYVTYTSASSQYLASAADARFTLTGSVPTPNPLFVISLLRASGTGPLVGLAANETSAATYPFMMIQPAGTDWGADIGTDGTAVSGYTAGRFQPTSQPAFAGGQLRIVSLGKGGFINSSNVDGIYRFTVAGHQQVRSVRAKTATAGSLKLVSGRLGAVYGNGDELWTIVIAFEPTATFWRNLKVYLAAQLAASVTEQAKAVVCSGSSLWVGSTNQVGGDPMTPIATSGTTSAPYTLVNHDSGGGSLASQMPDLTKSVQAYNYGGSGRNIQEMIDAFPYEVGIHTVDFARVVNFCIEIGNSVQGLGWSAATTLSKLAEYKALHDAVGAKFILYLGIDRGLGNSNGTGGANTGWYTSSAYTVVSVNGQVNLDVFVAVRANPGLYCHGYVDADANTKFKISALGNVNTACLSAVTYNVAGGVNDFVHLSPAGYADLGTLGADWLAANQGIWLSGGSLVIVRRRRR